MRTTSVEPSQGGADSPGAWQDLVEGVEGTQLIIGGPGTGKTELLAQRAAHLINSEITSSDAVLALSFSRETAADLRERVTNSARRSFGELSVGTFYALARTLVEEHSPQLFGSPQPPMLLTAPEQIHFVKEALADERPQVWPLIYRRMLHTTTLAEELADFMLRCGEQRIAPADLAVRARERPAWAALPGFYQRYLRRLEHEGKIDYTGLLLRANRALGMPNIIKRAADRFPYVLVDEYQEATLVQVEILRRLAGGGCHLTAAADPQQTSFSFRGAERASVNAFPATFDSVGRSPTRVFRLNTSHRVPREVLSSAGSLFGAQRPALPEPAPHTGRVDLHVFDQEMAENDWIASEIKRLNLIQGISFSHIAVLTRTTRPLNALSRALDRKSIPHARPGARLIDHPAVRLVLDLAGVASADRDPDPSPPSQDHIDRIMESVLLGPLFSLTEGRARELRTKRQRLQLPWSQLLLEEVRGARPLAGLLADPSWARNPPATNGFWKLWSRMPQFHDLAAGDQPGGYRSALFSFAQTLGRLAERSPRTSLLDYRRLTMEGDLEASPLLSPHASPDEQVTIGTIHQAKGRQFEVVFIFNAIEGVFPDTRPFRSLLEGQLLSQPNLDYSQLLDARLDEERNLAYIAMTRASRRVVWSATAPDLNEARRTVSRFAVHLADHAGVEPGQPQTRPDAPPVGRLETESYLRRTQRDANQPLPRRLAATATLARPVPTDLWDPRHFAGMRPSGSDLGLIDAGHVMSASQAEAYHKCPRQYALERRLRIRPPDENPYARFGQLIHQVLHNCGDASSGDGETHLDLSHALRELDDLLAGFNFGTAVLNQAWRERGAKLLAQLAERWNPEPGVAIKFEEAVETEMDGIRWKGRIDRIDRVRDGSLRVVDYKTSKNPTSVKDAKVSLQLGFYLWALSQTRPGERTSAAEFWFPLFEGNTWRRSFDPDNLADVTDLLKEIGRAVVSEGSDPQPWPAKPSRACGRCSVRSVCPAWPEGREAFIS